MDWGCYEVLVLLHAITDVPSWQVVKVLSASHREESWESLDSHSGSIAALSLHFKPRRRVTNDMARFDATTTPLAGNAVWTSGTLLTDTYDTVTGTVFADQAGTVNVEQSSDGTNWDWNTTVAASAGTGNVINVALVAPYFRIRYVNGATPSTIFRIKVKATAAGTR